MTQTTDLRANTQDNFKTKTGPDKTNASVDNDETKTAVNQRTTSASRINSPGIPRLSPKSSMVLNDHIIERDFSNYQTLAQFVDKHP